MYGPKRNYVGVFGYIDRDMSWSRQDRSACDKAYATIRKAVEEAGLELWVTRARGHHGCQLDFVSL